MNLLVYVTIHSSNNLSISKRPMNTDNDTFRVVAHLRSSAIIRGELCLESLLAACVHDTKGLVREQAMAEVPVEVLNTPEGPVWLASAAMHYGATRVEEHTVIRSRHFSEIGPDFYDPNPRARKCGWAVEQKAGDFMTVFNVYPLLQVSKIVWYAKGDMAACRSLLATQGWLGKRRGSGFGEVDQFEVRPWSGNPVVDPNGMVRRPVAVRKLSFLQGALPADRQRVIHAVDVHPFWLNKPELCAVSPSKTEPIELPPAGDQEKYYEV